MSGKSDISPFTLEIIKNGLIVASEEMFYSWGRTAKSPVIYEVLDYAVGLIDSTGNDLVTQAPGIPGFTGVLDFAAKEVVNKWKEDIYPGDIFVSNVPYESGTHLNDVTLIMPIFYWDQRLGFAVAKGHWSEVGGMHFGSWTSDSTEIYQEGLQLPCAKLFMKDEPNKSVIDIISFNSRLPDFVLGDMYAQVASMRVAARRVMKLVEKYGLETILDAMDRLLDDGERYAKLKLKELPKGTFKAEDWIDDDGITDDPIPVKVEVEITDEEFVVDFTGSGSAAGSINSAYPSTVSGVRETYMAMIDPYTHPNGGFFSPVKIIAPKGSVFNPERPAPTSTFWEGMSHAADIVWKALAPHVPDRLSAGHFLSIEATILGGLDDRTGEPFAIVEPQPGGWGASYNQDGESSLVACGDGETYIASSEVYERRTPILVERYALNTEDGTGHGRFRGGFGAVREYRVLCKEASLTVSAGRSKFPPWGVEGGMKGTPNYAVVYKKDQEPKEYRKVAALKMLKGEMVSLRTGGGGGWGDPLERDPDRVLWDVINEYVTLEDALKIYGVVIDENTLQMDRMKTEKIRIDRIKNKS